MASFGAWHAGSQAFLTGPITTRFGETRTIVLGICSDVIAFVAIAFVGSRSESRRARARDQTPPTPIASATRCNQARTSRMDMMQDAP